MTLKKSDIHDIKHACINFFVLGCVAVAGYAFLAANGLLPPGFVFPINTVCLVVGAGVAAFVVPLSLGTLCVFVLRRSFRKESRKNGWAIWGPLEEWQTPDDFKRYIKKSFQSATVLGYVPVGTYLVYASASGGLKTTCLVHPEGHSVIHLGQKTAVFSHQIHSYLDDGSVINSINLDDSVAFVGKLLGIDETAAQAHLDDDPEFTASLTYSDMTPYGYYVNRLPGATLEELIEAHDVLVRAALADPSIGLRKLSVENCRDYGLYSTRRFNQIQFELDKKDNAPKPFTFPTGELLENDTNKFVPEESRLVTS